MYTTHLLILNCIGIFASLLMFSGDMFLYFTKKDFKNYNALRTQIMRDMPLWRLTLGGYIGPFAAFFYAIAFLQISLIVHEQYKILGFIISGLFVLGVIVGGAYHSHYTYLGIISKTGDKTVFNDVLKTANLLGVIYMLPLSLGAVLLSVLIMLGKTIFPFWFVFFSPAVTVSLMIPWRYLPQPFRVILYGGWSNLLCFIYFALSLLFLL